MQQWARGNLGWKRSPSAGVDASLCGEGPRVRLCWLEDGAEPDVTHAATLVLSVAADEADLERRIAAVQEPLTPEVHGGSFRSYTPEDGTYEIGQGDPASVRVTFPADELERTVRLRHYRRKTDPRHRGAVAATVDGEITRAQLMSEGELTDDICVVMEMSHRNDSVDDVIVSAALKAEAPTTIGVDKLPGIQATYQSEISGLDLQRRAGNRRDLAVWSSRNKERPELELDLFSGAVHRWTNHGQTDPVLWEMPMAWFLSCGISRHHYCNTNDTFEVLGERAGPGAAPLQRHQPQPAGPGRTPGWTIPPATTRGHASRCACAWRWRSSGRAPTSSSPTSSPTPRGWWRPGSTDAVLFMTRGGSSLVYTLRPDLQRPQPGQGRPRTAPVLRALSPPTTATSWPSSRTPSTPGTPSTTPCAATTSTCTSTSTRSRTRCPPARSSRCATRPSCTATAARAPTRCAAIGERSLEAGTPGGLRRAMTMEPIRLTVTARDGQERSDWPLTRGVTLPEGAVGAAGELTLAGPEGAVPVQLRPLGALAGRLAQVGAGRLPGPGRRRREPPSTTCRPVRLPRFPRKRRWR